MVSVFPHIVKDSPKIRNLPKIFLRIRYDTIEEINVDSKAEYTA